MDCYFFGTFNPIHFGHLEIAQKVKALLGFKRVIFVPSYIPPHKNNIESYFHRLKMVKSAVGLDNVSDIESKLSVPSYTFKTIEELYKKNHNKKINFIIGYDQFFKIESWAHPEILKEKIHFIVIPRKFQNEKIVVEEDFKYFIDNNYSFEILNIDFLDVSSEEIRKKILNNQDITNLVTNEVKKYIERNNLYKCLA